MARNKKTIIRRMVVLTTAIALVFGHTGNVTISNAASKITLKSGKAAPASVYAGHSYTLKVAGTAVKFYSSNKSVATIGLTTGKLKPVAPGTVKITAKSKKTGKAVATKSFKVLQRATSISVEPTEINLGIGETYKLAATKKPATSTDVVKFYSSDKTIATVGMTSGKVTAKAKGIATITVHAMATKATSQSNRYNKTATVTVRVGAKLESAGQTQENGISAKFSYPLENTDAAKFVLTDANTGAEVKIIQIGERQTENIYNLTTASRLVKDHTYNLTYDGVTVEFKAEMGNEPYALYTSRTDVVVEQGSTEMISCQVLDQMGEKMEFDRSKLQMTSSVYPDGVQETQAVSMLSVTSDGNIMVSPEKTSPIGTYVVVLQYGTLPSKLITITVKESTQPIVTPEPTVTPAPTMTPEPILTPAPIVTPEPIVTPTPIVTPEPTITPEPTVIPEETVTPESTVTPEPTVTLYPEESYEPQETYY